ncbi:MAG TPA: hypothetical protein VLE69_01440 [Candidatus Saccharimonadales bacterium]|nr:hypothetical protein [Candidatus Saccharimonadales bacterium]
MGAKIMGSMGDTEGDSVSDRAERINEVERLAYDHWHRSERRTAKFMSSLGKVLKYVVPVTLVGGSVYGAITGNLQEGEIVSAVLLGGVSGAAGYALERTAKDHSEYLDEHPPQQV